ncbi:ATP-grasp domain-containing protein [Pseudomonadota bacterium]
MPNDEHVVLVGSAGTGTAFGAISALRRGWDDRVKIVAMDINPRHLVAASVLSDVCEQVPLSSTPEFERVLLDLIQRYKVDTYVPLVDTEIVFSARLRDQKKLPSKMHLLAPPTKSAELCLDKLATYEWLTQEGIETPATFPLKSAPSREFWFFKPRYGFGSLDARLVTANEISQLTEALRQTSVVQEPCERPEITVDVLYNEESDLCRVACRERVETKEGVCTKARIFSDSAITNLAEKIGRGLKFRGGFCFQVMVGPKEQWLVTDINARLGAGTAMSAAAGMDFFAAAFASEWGEDAAPFVPQPSRTYHVLRQYSEYVTEIKG